MKTVVGLLGVLVVCGVGELHAQQLPASNRAETVCGQVVSISCLGTTSPALSVEVDDALVSVNIPSGQGRDTRAAARGLLFRQVCASGTLNTKGTASQVPRFEVANINDITVMPGDPTPDWVRSGVYRTCDPGVGLPKVKRDSRPKYPREAFDAGVEGAIWVEAVVEVNGRVGDVRVIRSIDAPHGLDAEAVRSAKRWQFIPGTKDGQPAPVLVTIEQTFTIKADQP